jgi:ADP-ribosylglycohydrolase
MLAGVAVGDALGMPSEFLSPDTIRDWYDGGITDLRQADPRHPHSRLPAGSVTDDTDHTVLLAELLLQDGAIQPHALATRLLAWGTSDRVVRNRFVGPSTLKTLAALKDGAALEDVPRGGTSSGAAMRVAALAIALPDRDRLVEQVVASCAVSHFTRGAISGAMAMAFALGAALEQEATLEGVATAAKEGAVLGRQHGDWSWSAPLEKRIDHVLEWVDDLPEDLVLTNLFELIGVDMYGEQLVPDALGLTALAPGDPNRAMLLAANLGGDSDTLASLTGSLGGALWGIEAIDPDWVERVEAVNDLDLGALAIRLVAFRDGEPAPC